MEISEPRHFLQKENIPISNKLYEMIEKWKRNPDLFSLLLKVEK